MIKPIELLAPGGDLDSIKAAIAAGADAVYCGLNKFNARNRAENISFDNLNGILRLAHKHHCQVFLTLNILIVENELPALFGVLNRLANTKIDGIIVQDLGLLYLISRYFKTLKVHASTQLTTHNEGQIRFLKELSVVRVNLSRELNLGEIKTLTTVAHHHEMLTEVFVHGSNCICFSGLCYFSSVQSGNSGNRGRCSQPCRDQFETTTVGKDYPLNLKDNCAFADLRELSEAGVDSIKIEGRIKKFHYVYTVVDVWRNQLQRFYAENKVSRDISALYKVFNRGFSNAFLSGNIHKEMFIDHPRDHSAIHLSATFDGTVEENMEKAKGAVWEERTHIISNVEEKINRLSIAKVPITIVVSGECGSPLKMSVMTPDGCFELTSDANLTEKVKEPLTQEMLQSRLKAVNDTEYYIECIDVGKLGSDLSLPFKEFTSIKKSVLSFLNGMKESVKPISVPILHKTQVGTKPPSLSVLISSPKDAALSRTPSISVYYQVPNCFGEKAAEILALFKENNALIPWFPSVLIGEDYHTAIELLRELQPDKIVTDNTGIAYEAFRRGIPWIAGPFLNMVNSFSLLCLKEKFNCTGAFVSNELNKMQIKSIRKPENFDLYFSIYHPIVMMTSRQCLFHQVTGCEKERIDGACIQNCEKSAVIRHQKKEELFVEKSKGNYHRIYHGENLLNTEIVTEIPDLFAGFMVDLRDVVTATGIIVEKPELISLFTQLLEGNADMATELKKVISRTTNVQYKKGI